MTTPPADAGARRLRCDWGLEINGNAVRVDDPVHDEVLMRVQFFGDLTRLTDEQKLTAVEAALRSIGFTGGCVD